MPKIKMLRENHISTKKTTVTKTNNTGLSVEEYTKEHHKPAVLSWSNSLAKGIGFKVPQKKYSSFK